MFEKDTSFIAYLKSRGIDLKGKKVLDIGCGDGRVALALQQMGAHVYGIDKDEKALAIAKAKGVEHVLQYNATELANANPFGEIKFDLVLSICQLPFLSHNQRSQMIHGISHHCLATDGALLMHVPPFINPQGFSSQEDMGTYSKKAQEHTNAAQALQLKVSKTLPSKRYKFAAEAEKLYKKARTERANATENHNQHIGALGNITGRYFNNVEVIEFGRGLTDQMGTDCAIFAQDPKQIEQCPPVPITTDHLTLSKAGAAKPIHRTQTDCWLLPTAQKVLGR